MPCAVEGRLRFYDSASLKWFIAEKKKEVERGQETGERSQLELERLRHKNREAKVKADLAEGGAVALDVVVGAWTDAVGAIRAEVLRIPERYADIVNPVDPAAGEDALDIVAEKTLQSLREALVSPIKGTPSVEERSGKETWYTSK